MNHIKTGRPRCVISLKRIFFFFLFFFYHVTPHSSLVSGFFGESGCHRFSFFLRLVSVYSESFSYRPYIGCVGFLDVDGKDLTAVLVVGVELLEIREKSPEWISGVASREHNNGFRSGDEPLEGKEDAILREAKIRWGVLSHLESSLTRNIVADVDTNRGQIRKSVGGGTKLEEEERNVGSRVWKKFSHDLFLNLLGDRYPIQTFFLEGSHTRQDVGRVTERFFSLQHGMEGFFGDKFHFPFLNW